MYARSSISRRRSERSDNQERARSIAPWIPITPAARSAERDTASATSPSRLHRIQRFYRAPRRRPLSRRRDRTRASRPLPHRLRRVERLRVNRLPPTTRPGEAHARDGASRARLRRSAHTGGGCHRGAGRTLASRRSGERRATAAARGTTPQRRRHPRTAVAGVDRSDRRLRSALGLAGPRRRSPNNLASGGAIASAIVELGAGVLGSDNGGNRGALLS